MSQCIAISTGYAGIPILTLNHSWRGTLNRTDTLAFSQPALNHDITMPDQWLQSLKETNQLLVIQDNIIACKKLVNHCWFHYKNQSKRDWNFVIPLKFLVFNELQSNKYWLSVYIWDKVNIGCKSKVPKNCYPLTKHRFQIYLISQNVIISLIVWQIVCMLRCFDAIKLPLSWRETISWLLHPFTEFHILSLSKPTWQSLFAHPLNYLASLM